MLQAAPAAGRVMEGVRCLTIDSKATDMWRGFFSAVGIVLIICGLECMVLDHAVLADRGTPNQQANAALEQFRTVSLFGNNFGNSVADAAPSRVFRPAEGTPWSLLASGAITLLYAISYRKPG